MGDFGIGFVWGMVASLLIWIAVEYAKLKKVKRQSKKQRSR